MSLFQWGASYFRKLTVSLQVRSQGKLQTFEHFLPYVQGKHGLEIGGPSEIFQKGRILPIYPEIGRLDNCDFSKSNVWAEHSEKFVFDPNKSPGNAFFCDGSNLVEVPDSTYDILLSSHNLEHFANPIKALKEWQRVLKPSGALVLVLPYYQATFDHRRRPTRVDHMFDDFSRNIGENDLTHLDEILEKHDLSMDPPAGSKEDFHKRSINNYSNRCLHHHVFDKRNSRELLVRVGFDVLSVYLAPPHHICILASTI
jgi:ubiquinone/menaquinone biosynthesis C-methylase UbiE